MSLRVDLEVPESALRTHVPAVADSAAGTGDELVVTTRAMATEVTVRVALGDVRAAPEELRRAAGRALEVFHVVERACTRFDPTSPLMRANAAPGRWHRVPPALFAAVEEAHRAYEQTSGRFDPRVLRDLRVLGYDRTLPFASGDAQVVRPGQPSARRQRSGSWRPRFHHAAGELHLGGEPIDLGGIGKGLAVRWASAALAAVAPDHLVEAGGDCHCAGSGPGAGRWMVAVEDPFGSATPVAVLALADRAATTSSIRLRRWKLNGRPVHHLIDPRSGRPGGDGLVAVTVVGADPATAEVWSKVLFVSGRRRIADEARRRAVAALWVDVDGVQWTSPGMERYVTWRRP